MFECSFYYAVEVTPDRAMEGLFRLSNWHGLGIQLNMQPHELAKIKEDFQTVDRCRNEMLNTYINKRKASWFSIVRGLLHISEYALANDLANKYGEYSIVLHKCNSTAVSSIRLVMSIMLCIVLSLTQE